jgi:hypothetical protein
MGHRGEPESENPLSKGCSDKSDGWHYRQHFSSNESVADRQDQIPKVRPDFISVSAFAFHGSGKLPGAVPANLGKTWLSASKRKMSVCSVSRNSG